MFYLILNIIKIKMANYLAIVHIAKLVLSHIIKLILKIFNVLIVMKDVIVKDVSLVLISFN